MEFAANVTLAALVQQILVGLSRTTILFIVASGLSLVLGVLRIPNIAHGSLYMIGAFLTYTIATLFGQSAGGFWLALLVAPLGVALISFVVERGLFLPSLRTRAHDAPFVHLRLFSCLWRYGQTDLGFGLSEPGRACLFAGLLFDRGLAVPTL